jgi:hypothetical protein
MENDEQPLAFGILGYPIFRQRFDLQSSNEWSKWSPHEPLGLWWVGWVDGWMGSISSAQDLTLNPAVRHQCLTVTMKVQGHPSEKGCTQLLWWELTNRFILRNRRVVQAWDRRGPTGSDRQRLAPRPLVHSESSFVPSSVASFLSRSKSSGPMPYCMQMFGTVVF